ncbi:FAD-dependent oxidoreductase [Bdellovibrio sp. 22V]|uniref:FAD-dependent oxidoreductase n=1 Tax=Bdellovibrio TaxID=958 RepID=UPI0025437CF7|nr:FAD-dependent oxidoreductase [Bdellovibrio sp. 22V]WII71535.1 FAD-dependent oxidoreductase [Bdellovibrio sp. 22V]
MATSAKVSGPNFAQGISEDSLLDGETMLGHVGDEPVLLVRQEGEYFAIGAVCTHYGGPLEKGTITGREVRCPWHHSCFDIRTGEALKAPALNPVAAWHVEVCENKVYVTDKKAPVIKPRFGTEFHRHVIIGAGAAGISAAVMLRRQGFQGTITVVSEDKALPYDRPNLSKDFMAGNAPEEWIPLYPPEFYRENKIHLELGVVAEKIDAHRKHILLSNGKSLLYDKCLIATGGHPVKPPIPGIDKDHIYFLRTLQDCRRIIARTSWAVRVVIIGAGFIGLEVAASLRMRNMEVHVVAPESMPLMGVVGVHVGSFLKKLHEEHGVHFHLGYHVKEIRDRSVVLDNGQSLDCDFVVVGTGIRPNTSLAEQAGLKTDHGVLVNEYLETSSSGIFAAGDIAKWPDPRSQRLIRVEHWEVAERQGQVAALNMLGDRVKFDDVPFFWTTHYDVSLGYIGFSDRFDRMDVIGDIDKRDFAVAYYEDQRVAALLTVGRDLENLQVEEALEHLDDKRVHEIFREYERRAFMQHRERPNYTEPSP